MCRNQDIYRLDLTPTEASEVRSYAESALPASLRLMFRCKRNTTIHLFLFIEHYEQLRKKRQKKYVVHHFAHYHPESALHRARWGDSGQEKLGRKN